MKRDSTANNRIIAGGRSRIIRDNLERIRNEVEVRYARELAEAGWFRRILIRQRIRTEIRRKLKQVLDKIAPTGGLYARTAMKPEPKRD